MAIDLKKIQKTNKESDVGETDWITGLLQKEISFGSGFSTKKKQYFFNQLVTLIEAGVTLKEALLILLQEQKKENDKKLLSDIEDHIIRGKSFSESLELTGKFSEYDFFSVQIGEESGNLIKVLKSLSDYYQRQIEQKRDISGALTYPIIIFSTSVLAVVFMLKFVVPMFKDIFSRVGGELPYLTKQIIRLSNWMENYLWLLGLILLAFIVSLRLLKSNITFQKIKDILLLKIPYVGNLILKAKLAQMSRALELLISADVPLLNALRMVNNMIRFYPLNSSIKKLSGKIERGSMLNEALKQEKVFPARFRSMVKVGEETNRLPYIFKMLNKQYSDDVQHNSKQLSTIMEPLIIIFLGLFVALILISMYLPIFQISTSFS